MGIEIAGSRVAIEDVVRLAIDAAVDGVYQCVAPARLRVLEEGCAQDAFS